MFAPKRYVKMPQNRSKSDDEQRLLSAFLSGNLKAIRVFFKRYGGIIKHAVGKINIKGNLIEREDLFHEAVIYILKNDMKIVREFKGKCKFSTYLYTVCRRFAIKMAKKEHRMLLKKETSLSPEELPAVFVEQFEVYDENQKKALLQAIEELDVNSQIFINMMFYDNRTTSEIMNFFDWSSPNSVYGKKNKIITKLRKILKHRGLSHV